MASRLTPKTVAGNIVKRADPTNSGADGVFSRAFLLSRLATDLHRWLWQELRLIAPHGAAAWQSKLLEEFAKRSNLYAPHESGMNFSDLEADLEVEIDDLDLWLGSSPFTGYDLCTSNSEGVFKLCRFERVGLWEAQI